MSHTDEEAIVLNEKQRDETLARALGEDVPNVVDFPIRRCRVCGCTDEQACSIPCSWSPMPGDDICIHCFVMRLDLQRYFIRVHDRSIWDLHAEDMIRRILAEPGMISWIRAGGGSAPIPPRPDPDKKFGPLDADWHDSLAAHQEAIDARESGLIIPGDPEVSPMKKPSVEDVVAIVAKVLIACIAVMALYGLIRLQARPITTPYKITYSQDPRTAVCFAFLSLEGTATIIGFSQVDCAAVPAELLERVPAPARKGGHA